MWSLKWAPPVCAIVLVSMSWRPVEAAGPLLASNRTFVAELIEAQQDYLIALSAQGYFTREQRTGGWIIGQFSLETAMARLHSLGMTDQEIVELERTGIPTRARTSRPDVGIAFREDRASAGLRTAGPDRPDEAVPDEKLQGKPWPHVQVARSVPHPPRVMNLAPQDGQKGVIPAVELALIKAIIAQESSFRANAIRFEARLQDASYGLMQLLSGTARSLGYVGHPLGLLDPATNLFYGVLYLRRLMNKYARIEDVIAAYNAGRPMRIESETYVNQGYVNGVLKHLRHFRAESVGAGS